MDVPFYIRNSNLIKILWKSVLLLGTFYIINWSLYILISNAFFSHKSTTSGVQISYAIQQGAEALILGSSRAAHHYNPDILYNMTGVTFYNAGREGANASYQLGVLSLITTKRNVALVIYEVGDFGKNLDHSVSYLYPFYKSNRVVKNIIKIRDKWAFLKFKIPLYAYNGDIFINVLNGIVSGTKQLNSNGFEPRAKVLKTQNQALLSSQA